MKKVYRAGLLAVILTTGCLSQSPTLSPTPIPTKVGAELTLQAWEDAPPAICTQLPPGVEMTVNALFSHEVQVIVRGLQPGEDVSFEFTTKSAPPGTGKTIRESPTIVELPELAKGIRTTTLGGLHAEEGSTTNVWTIKVIHPRGVGCEDVTFPMP